MKLFRSLFLLGALASSAPAFAHELVINTRSWVDGNDNGLIDCGEPVVLNVGVFGPGNPGEHFSGRLTVPFGASANFSYAGVEQDFVLTGNCVATIVAGNSPGDSQAILDYSCHPQPAPSDDYAINFLVRGFYTGPSGLLIVRAQDVLATPFSSTTQEVLSEANVDACTTVDLRLSKTDGGVSVLRGNTVAYTLTVVNDGTTFSPNTILSETVPAESQFDAAASSPGWACAGYGPGSSCTLGLGSLVAGGSASRTFAVTAHLATLATSLINTASVDSATTDENPANNTASDTTPIAAGTPDLTVSKTAHSTGLPGNLLAWTLTVANQGNGLAANVVLSESLPAFTTFDAAASDPAWSCSGSNCTLSLGTLTPGQSVSRAFAARLANSVPAELTVLGNTACAATTTANDPTANNCGVSSVQIDASPRLDLSKSVSGPASPGATLTWTLVATNTGNRDATTVTFTETIPPHSSFLAAGSSPGWACSGSAPGSTCTLSAGPLPAGSSLSRTFATVVANPLPANPSDLTNSACVSTPGSPDACDTVIVPPDGSPSLAFSKSLQSGAGIPGSTLVFALTVQNTGNQGAASVTLTETVPLHSTFLAAESDPAWSCASSAAGSNCTLSVGTLAGGSSATRLFAVVIDSPLPEGVSQVTNAACAQSASTSNACDSIDVPATAAPLLSVVKTRTSPALLSAGSLVTYSIVVRNDGNQNATVQVTDSLPAGTAFSAPSSPGFVCSAPTGPADCTRQVSVPAGTEVSLSFGLVVGTPPPPRVVNVACAQSGATSACSTTDDPVAGAPPSVSLTKTYAGAPLAPGALLTFQLTATNTGSAETNGVRFRETVPAHSTFVAASSHPAWSCSSPAAGSSCTLTVPALAAGASFTAAFSVRAASPLPAGLSQISNSACALDASGDTLTCDDETTPLSVALELDLEASQPQAWDLNGDGYPSEGERLRYTLRLMNPSSEPAQAVILTLPSPDHAAFVAGTATSTAGTVAQGNAAGDTQLVVSFPSVAPGAEITVEIEVLLHDLAGVSEIVAQADVTGSNIEREPSNDPSTSQDDDPTIVSLRQASIADIPTLSQVGLLALIVAISCASHVFLRSRFLP